MKSMGTTSKNLALSSQDVCTIIKACADSGVSILKFGNLNVEFGRPTKTTVNQEEINSSITAETKNQSTNTPDKEISEEERKLLQEKALLEDEQKSKQDEIDHMLVEDPALAEELISSGELEDDDESDGSDDE